jgi:hypothetical protein
MKLNHSKPQTKMQYYCCRQYEGCDCDCQWGCMSDPIKSVIYKCVTECCNEVMCDGCCLESCDKSRSSLYIQERIKKDIVNYNRLSDETVYLLKHIGPVCTYCGQLFKIGKMKNIKSKVFFTVFHTNNELIPTPGFKHDMTTEEKKCIDKYKRMKTNMRKWQVAAWTIVWYHAHVKSSHVGGKRAISRIEEYAKRLKLFF